MKRKLFVLIIVILILSSNLIACKKNTDKPTQIDEHPKVVITMRDGKKINIELYPEYAPKTVENFLKLVDENYYENIVFHRIIFDFMVQAGEYKITEDNTIERAESKDKVVGEFALNGFTQNSLPHTFGVISMARVSLPIETEESLNSASTQFFICTKDTPHLDGIHAAFGKVMDNESLDNLIDISQIPKGYFIPIEHYPGMDDFPIKDKFTDSVVALGAIIESIKRLD